MAIIDKLYCESKKDFTEFYKWCVTFDDMCQKDVQKSMLDFFYTNPEHYDKAYSCYTSGVPVANFPVCIDVWLIRHCPLRWVRERLNEQYRSLKIKKKYIALYIDRA